MSHVAENPATVPADVGVKFGTDALITKGKRGELSFPLRSDAAIELSNGKLTLAAKSDNKQANAMSSIARTLVNSMIKGVSEGFKKKLQLIGVGYCAQAQGKVLNLSLSLSRPIVYEMPEGASTQTPSQTKIVLTGANKQVVGQVAAEIHIFRSPKSYKDKDTRYVGEIVVMKKTKEK